MGAVHSLGLALVLGFGATLLVRAVARRYELVVAPRHDRWHSRPTALYGGVAIAFGTLGGFAVQAMQGAAGVPAAVAIFGPAAILFAIGIVDDARGIGPVGKFILQVSAGSLLVAAGVVYPLSPWGPVNVLVTLFWYVGVVNALNLLDNMDGITAGVAAVAALAFAALFAAAGAPALVAVSLAAAGASIGFLAFNFNPASIFMGDGGSLFLGAVLAGLGAAYPQASEVSGFAALLIPLVVLVVPILDTGLVTITRTLNGRRISIGGRDHSTHRLVEMGFSERSAALILYAVGGLAFSVAWVMTKMDSGAGVWLGSFFLTGVLVVGGYLGLLHRYDADGTIERKRAVFPREILLKRRGLVLLLDVVLFGVAYYGAFVIYYDGRIPHPMAEVAGATLAMVIVLKLAAFHYFHVYRGAWTRAGLADVHRVAKATLLAGLLAVGAIFLLARGAEIPRTVFVLDVLLTGALAMMARSSVRSLERFRKRLSTPVGRPTIIWGAGREADLVLHVLSGRTECSDYRVIGYVDDKEGVGTLIHGLPVLGSSSELTRVLAQTSPVYIILSVPLPEGPLGQQFRSQCEQHGVVALELDLSLRPVTQETASASGSASELSFAAR